MSEQNALTHSVNLGLLFLFGQLDEHSLQIDRTLQ